VARLDDVTPANMNLQLHINVGVYHSADLLTARGVAHLVVHRTSGSTSYETIPHVDWRPDMELGHWVTASMGHLGHLSRPGHHFDPV